MRCALVCLALVLLPACSDLTRLTAELRSADPARRRAAACALGELGSGAASAVPDLLRTIDDPEAGEVAIQALGEIGQGATNAVGALVEASRSGTTARRALACWALGRIATGEDDVAVALDDAASSTDVLVRQAARGARRRLRRS